MSTGALQVVDQVKRLCGELVPALIEDFLWTQSPVLADRSERAHIRRCGAQVCEALFRTCPAWPNTDPRRLSQTARLAVHQALRRALELRRAGQSRGTAGRRVRSAGTPGAGNGGRWPVNHADPAWRTDELNLAASRHRWLRGVDGWADNADDDLGPVLRFDQAPTTDLDFDDRQITRATSSDAMAHRYDWLEARRHRRNLHNAVLAAVGVLAAPAVFVALVLGLRSFAPGLTVDQHTRIVVAAFNAAAGLTGVAGLGLAGRIFWTRMRRNHGAADRGPAGDVPTRPAGIPAPVGRDSDPAGLDSTRKRPNLTRGVRKADSFQEYLYM